MALPKTYTAYRRTTGAFPKTIEVTTETIPETLNPSELLLKIHAVSLNYRDVAMLEEGKYPAGSREAGIPASDAAAEVVAMGRDVKDFKVGDRVSPIFDVNNLTGRDDTTPSLLGGEVHGVLAEYVVSEEKQLVKLPDYLSWEESSLLTCAGVTAWNTLNPLLPTARAAFFQGTGGVSMFGTLLALAAGVQPIITSSSDEKLESIAKLGSEIRGINYKTHPDQLAEVMRLTDGKGVDIVVNNTGPASIPADIALLRSRGGMVSLVGFLEGLGADWNPSEIFGLLPKSATLKGIAVGSKVDYQNLNQFLQEKKVSLTPIIDRVFPFNESKAAFDYLYSGKHVGKIVIKM